ncbi:helix-turn-helix domain-containing protein [Actinoplanes bogorensis]|uniref:Helix-turn-helix domain-containing protein n=1 Tax=Paractinoplanes bogorensis TaxID=1610840 RepID=A0ABS5YQN4_9ACTN|nr:helix-turn-helix domain-containing protein [Actinoplanes bogorensis]MBU2665752.1 helix-turn-helix domain-containing protein [Actinoplanes bogorensis]
MHPPAIRKEALRLHAAGVPFSEIYRRLGISRNTVACWLYNRRQRATEIDNRCPRCDSPARAIDDPASYAYLLGQYLGDGHLLMTQRVPLLTVSSDQSYPGLIHEVSYAMEACGARTVGFQERPGCISIRSHWTHWPCLIPQHGRGAKHRRVIELSNWQQEVISARPGRFLRGLFHSDGSRSMNRVVRNGRAYSYPRYNFVNESTDIMGLCAQTLDLVHIAWRMARPNLLSVARREAVARLDEFVGPKW